jgi:general secretion pathway protein D
VVRDAAASDALMLDRYDAIRALQQAAQPAPSTVLRSVSGAPVLPALGPEVAPGAAAAPRAAQPASAPTPASAP